MKVSTYFTLARYSVVFFFGVGCTWLYAHHQICQAEQRYFFQNVAPHWTKSQFPLKVRFSDTNNLTTEARKNWETAMALWSATSRDKALFRPAYFWEKPDITIQSRSVSGPWHGVCFTAWEKSGRLQEAVITLIPETYRLSSATQVRLMAHELGHALGLVEKDGRHGHSPITSDIMYPVQSSESTKPLKLSEWDITAIRRLYD